MNIPRRIHPDTVDAREGLEVGEYGIYPVEQVRSLIARAEEVVKELAEEKALARRFAKFIVTQGRFAGGDWACSLCRPYSDMLKDGFVCAFHKAETIIAARKEIP